MRETRRLRRGAQENKGSQAENNTSLQKPVDIKNAQVSEDCSTPSIEPLQQLSFNTPSTPVLFPRMLDLSAHAPLEGQLPEPVILRGDADNIKVVVRARPSSSAEAGEREAVQVHDSQTLGFTCSGEESRFSFDYAADGNVSQLQFFRVVGRPIVENCLNGYNSSVLAYGQTGSGKTFTMLGQIPARAEEMPEQAGLIPRMFQYLFDRIKQLESIKREGREVCFLCKVSCLEIYQEVITDLLCPERTRLQLREDLRHGIYVDSLSEEVVTDGEDVVRLLRQGTANRHTGGTRTNALSSRSHCVFTCVVESQTVEDGVTSIRTSRLHLVDLAGSERQKVAESEGERLKEASSINRSLSTLGLVINKLAGAHKQPTHIPYRDSRLTFLLQDSLGGNAKTVIIANVSPVAGCARETQSTLGFAQRAKQIVNKARVNEDTRGEAALLTRENERLRRELQLLSETYQALRQARPASAKSRQEDEGSPVDVEEAVAAAEEQWSGRLNKALTLTQDLEARVAELQKQGSRMRRDRDALDAALSATKVQMELLVEAHMDANQRANRAEEGLTAAQEALAAASDEVLTLRAEMRDMRKRLAQTGAANMGATAMSSTERAAEASRRWDELLSEREALEAQVKDLSLQAANGDCVIEKLHSTIAAAEREKARVAEEASEMQWSFVQLQAELSAACKDKADLEVECENLRTAVEQYRQSNGQDLADAKTACSLLQAQLNCLQAEVASKEAAVAECKAKSAQDAEALQGRDAQLAANSDMISSLEAKLKSLTEALRKAHAQSSNEVQWQTKLHSELKDAKQALEEVRKKRAGDAEQILSLEAQVAYKSKALVAAKANHAAAEQARQRLVQRDNEISARINEMQQDMAAHLAQVQELRSQSARLTEEKAQAQGHMRALQEDLARSQHHCQELQAQHCEALAAVKADARSRAAALQEQLAEVSGERDFFMAQGSESAGLAAVAVQERDAAREHLGEVQQELEEKKAALSSLQAKLDSAARERDSLKAETAALQQRMTAAAGSAEAESASLAAAMASLERRLDQQRSEADVRTSQLQADAAEASRQLEEAAAQCHALSTRLESSEADRSSLAAAKAVLEQKQSEAEAVIAQLRQQAAETGKKVAVLEAKYRDAKERLAAHDVEVSSLGEAMASLEKRLAEAESQAAEVRQREADALTRLEDAERNQAEAEDRADAAKAAAEAHAASMEDATASLREQLAAQRADADARIAELAAGKADAAAQLARVRAQQGAAVQEREAELAAALLAAQSRADKAARALEAAQQQKVAADEDLAASQAEVGRLQREVATLHEECKGLQVQSEQADLRAREAEEKRTEAQAALLAIQADADALRRDAADVLQKLHSCEDKVKQLRSEGDQRAAAAAAEAERARAVQAELKLQAQAANERVAKVSATLHDLRAQHAEARCELGSKTAALQDSMEQLIQATTRANALEAGISDMARALQEEQSTSQRLTAQLSARNREAAAESVQEAKLAELEMLTKDLQERLQQRQLEAEAQASTIANLRGGVEDKVQEIARLETAVRALQHDKEEALKAVEAERAAGREAAAHARRGMGAEELDRLLSSQRHSAERDKEAALAGLKALYAAEIARRDGDIRDLRAQRDSVMASVRQRDAALQVIDLQKSRAVEARDAAAERLRVALAEHNEATQQLSDLRTVHEASLEATVSKASEWKDKLVHQSGEIEDLQQHVGHLEHLLEIEAASRQKALSTHKEALAALEAERSRALKRLKELRARQGKGLLTRLVSEQRFTLSLPQRPTSALPIPEVKRYERMLSP